MAKKYGLQLLPASVEGPAFGLMIEGVGVDDRLVDRDGDVREDRADDEVDLVALDEALRLGHRDVRLQLVVDDDDLDLPPAELAAEVLDGELEAVARLLAEHGRGARQRQDQADLELLLRLRRARQRGSAPPQGRRL